MCVAELRAENTAKMLRDFVKEDKKIASRVDIQAQRWDSYDAMCRERGIPDLSRCEEEEGQGGAKACPQERACYDEAKGLMNRRAEIRVVRLPECVNISLPPVVFGQASGESR